MTRFENICLGAITAGVLFLAGEGAMFFRALRFETYAAGGSIQGAAKNFNDLVTQTSATEKAVFDAATVLSAQVAQQQAGWQKAQLQVYKTITDSKEILVRTDRSLNDVLVPRLAAALDSSTALTSTASANLNKTMNELQPTFENFAKASAAAATTMADPRIADAVANVDDATASTAETSDHVEKSAADIQAFVHRETTPVRGTWNVIKRFLMEFAGPAASVATAVK